MPAMCDGGWWRSPRGDYRCQGCPGCAPKAEPAKCGTCNGSREFTIKRVINRQAVDSTIPCPSCAPPVETSGGEGIDLDIGGMCPNCREEGPAFAECLNCPPGKGSTFVPTPPPPSPAAMPTVPGGRTPDGIARAARGARVWREASDDVRSYVAALETECDPAGTLREAVMLRDEVAMRDGLIAPLRADVARLTREWAATNEALVLAVGVLMRPVDGTPDQELLDARMACLRTQAALAARKGQA